MPNPSEKDHERAAAVLTKHGFSTVDLHPAPFQGESNFTWLTDQVALRVPRKLENDQGLLSESIVVPAARSAGVLTPDLLVLDQDRDVIPTLASIYERSPGIPLAWAKPGVQDLQRIAEQIARELFKLHSQVHVSPEPAEWLQPTWVVDFESALRTAADSGVLDARELKFAQSWAASLESVPESPLPPRFLHHDIHALNVLVAPDDPGRLTAILDWSDAGWGDVTGEFPMVTAWSAPLFAQAYKRVAALADPLFEGRLVRLILFVTLTHVAEPESGTPLFDYGRTAWESLMTLWRDEASEAWRQWMPVDSLA